MDEFKNNDNLNEYTEELTSFEESAAEDSVVEDEVIAPPKRSMKKELLDWIISIVVALAVALFIRQFIFTLVRVDGPSMLPTLHHNDTLYVNRFMYTPEVGDVIIFRPPNSPDTPYVKRVIATAGQEVIITPMGDGVEIDGVEYDGQSVYVDGVKLEEDYISEHLKDEGTVKYPFLVPEDHVFVLGDNRNNSHDSRSASVGAVPHKNIIGKVIFRVLPVSDFGSIYN